MTDKLDDILQVANETRNEVKQLKSWLYGSNGYEGDIPQIKGKFRNHEKRIRRAELIIATIIGTGCLGAGIVGVVQYLGG